MGKMELRVSLLEEKHKQQQEFLLDFKQELIKRFDASDLKQQAIHTTTQEIMIHNAKKDSEFEQVQTDVKRLRAWKNGVTHTALVSSLAAAAFWIKHRFFHGGG